MNLVVAIELSETWVDTDMCPEYQQSRPIDARATPPSTRGISPLNQKIWDNSMKQRITVIPLPSELVEVFTCAWSMIPVQFKGDIPHACFQYYVVSSSIVRRHGVDVQLRGGVVSELRHPVHLPVTEDEPPRENTAQVTL
jgi:hypothetical protein